MVKDEIETDMNAGSEIASDENMAWYNADRKDGYKKGYHDSDNDVDVGVKNGMDIEPETGKTEIVGNSDIDADGNSIPVGY